MTIPYIINNYRWGVALKDYRTKTSKSSILTTILICIVCILIVSIKSYSNKDSIYAVISVDGTTVKVIELSSAKDEVFSIDGVQGITFEVNSNRVRFATNDCKNQVCVHTGYISKVGDMAVCLPKKTTIQIKDNP